MSAEGDAPIRAHVSARLRSMLLYSLASCASLDSLGMTYSMLEYVSTSSSRYGSSRWTVSNEASAESKSGPGEKQGKDVSRVSTSVARAQVDEQGKRTSEVVRDHGLLARAPDPRPALAPALVGLADAEHVALEVLDELADGLGARVQVELGVDLKARRERVRGQQRQERLELLDR